MKVTTTTTNLLPHISLNEGLPSQVNVSPSPAEVTVPSTGTTPDLLETTALEPVSGSYTFFGFLVVDYSLSITPPEVKIDLYITALGKKVRIAGVDINPNNPTVKIGGSALGFKAELDASFDFSTYVLTLKATGCVPILGCKTGTTHIHL